MVQFRDLHVRPQVICTARYAARVFAGRRCACDTQPASELPVRLAERQGLARLGSARVCGPAGAYSSEKCRIARRLKSLLLTAVRFVLNTEPSCTVLLDKVAPVKINCTELYIIATQADFNGSPQDPMARWAAACAHAAHRVEAGHMGTSGRTESGQVIPVSL
jgi:hypothetical protein